MSFLSSLDYIEVRYDENSADKWMSRYWWLSVIASAVYVLLVRAGRSWMRDKSALSLRRPLVMWNTALAVFSFFGVMVTLPPVATGLWERGLGHTVCNRLLFSTPQRSLWCFLFTVFKMVELGDTAFVVLRKTPLSFLHWYHHVSVMIYCWGLYTHKPGAANWFILLNYFVHFLMYTYYAFKAGGYPVPSSIAKVITVLQMAQFVMGLSVTLLAYRLWASGVECHMTDQVFYFAIILYGSYLLLFLNFFYNRYLKK